MGERDQTTGDLGKQIGEPEWLVRRTLDRIAPDAPRFKQYRIVSPALAVAVRAAIRQMRQRQREREERRQRKAASA
jgi:hypothetical protein